MSDDDRKFALFVLTSQMQVVASAAKRLERESGECARQVERLRDELERRGRGEVTDE